MARVFHINVGGEMKPQNRGSLSVADMRGEIYTISIRLVTKSEQATRLRSALGHAESTVDMNNLFDKTNVAATP